VLIAAAAAVARLAAAARYPSAMSRLAVRRLLVALLALAQLLPLAHAFAGQSSGSIDVCTSAGIRPVADGEAPTTLLHPGEHCPLCRTADALTDSLPDPTSLTCLPAVHETPRSIDAAPARQAPRHGAQARAPPWR